MKTQKKSKGFDILFYFVISYVMIAGGWWSYLLYIKNEDALLSKKEVLWYKMKENGNHDEQSYLESVQYTKLEEQYGRQKWMIFSESAVLLILTILGIWRIAKSRQKEIEVANQQRNFLLSITHELKSPIAAIKLALQTFNRRKLNEQQHAMLTTNALSDIHRLNKLVEDLLLAARVDGGYSYSFSEADLVQLLNKSIEIASSNFDGEIVFNHASNQAIVQRADHAMLTSAFLNIIENAVKYAKESKKIIVNLKSLKNQYSLEIVDFGQGIPKAERDNIFNKFYRIGNEDTRKTKGTGLGLHIVKQVITAHKGLVSVKANVPNGSIFSILLPDK
jgi:signal transduction histidine kinase